MGERSTVRSLRARRLVLRQLEHGDLRWRERVPAFPLPGRGEVHDAGPGWSHQNYAHALPSRRLLRPAGGARSQRRKFGLLVRPSVVTMSFLLDTLAANGHRRQLSASAARGSRGVPLASLPWACLPCTTTLPRAGRPAWALVGPRCRELVQQPVLRAMVRRRVGSSLRTLRRAGAVRAGRFGRPRRQLRRARVTGGTGGGGGGGGGTQSRRREGGGGA